jgi:hypothetical protein
MKNEKIQVCIKCLIEKEMAIGKKRGKNYYCNMCVLCVKEIQKIKSKIYYDNNKDRYNEMSKLWTLNNRERKQELNKKRKEKKEKYSISKKLWIKNNPEKIKEMNIKRNKNMNSLQKLKNNMRNSIRLYIQREGFIKKSKTESILGCSFNDFKLYLESKFEIWMTWENYGKFNGEFSYGWDIDHIIPLSSASTEEEIISLNHYSNLQPLCSKVNRYIKKNLLEYNI